MIAHAMKVLKLMALYRNLECNSWLMNQPIYYQHHLLASIHFCFPQLNLVIESRLHSSFYQKCHHQNIYNKLNLKIYYPPPYEREIWHYKNASIDLIQRTINYYSWERPLAKNDINEKVYIFAKTIKYIFHLIQLKLYSTQNNFVW